MGIIFLYIYIVEWWCSYLWNISYIFTCMNKCDFVGFKIDNPLKMTVFWERQLWMLDFPAIARFDYRRVLTDTRFWWGTFSMEKNIGILSVWGWSSSVGYTVIPSNLTWGCGVAKEGLIGDGWTFPSPMHVDEFLHPFRAYPLGPSLSTVGYPSYKYI